jgi:hypothetical protein
MHCAARPDADHPHWTIDEKLQEMVLPFRPKVCRHIG